MSDLDARIRRRSNRAVGAILAALDEAPLPQTERTRIRRVVMNTVHGYGTDVAQLVAGLAEASPDTVMADGWLDLVGFPDTPEAEDRAAPLRAAAGFARET